MLNKEIKTLKTIGDLKKSGYLSRSIKDELRENLITKLKMNEPVFKGVIGYETTVIPDIQRAILSRHNITLLGLRGQAKTRIARLLVELLDEWMPIVQGSEMNDDPLNPISRYAIGLIAEKGDQTPIEWIHKTDRYSEKLATPDVSVADLIGDVDPIKAANLKLAYSDERVIHFGIIPRSNRGIFVINELPDLQPRIQVALFNILQEGDIQIRGFKIRMPLDIQFIFTANPEDYTNRGSIVTPLKDRIESQILTHYPKDLETSKEITIQEAKLSAEQEKCIHYSPAALNLNEQISFEARQSEFVDAKSGVSARLTISAFENLISAAERRMIMNNEKKTAVRLTDFWGVIPAITGKIELVYEGEQEGPMLVAQNLISKATRTQFVNYFPDPGQLKKKKQDNVYERVTDWFAMGNTIDLLSEVSNAQYETTLKSVSGLEEVVNKCQPKATGLEKLFFMEFVLHGLAEYSMLSKFQLEKGLQFKDFLSTVFTSSEGFQDDYEN